MYRMQTDGTGIYDIGSDMGNVRSVGLVVYGSHNVDWWAKKLVTPLLM
jgi:hypothetical protein